MKNRENGFGEVASDRNAELDPEAARAGPRPDLSHLSDDEFRAVLLGGGIDGVEASDFEFYDPNFLAQFRGPMTEADEQALAEALLAACEVVVSALEAAAAEKEARA